MMSLAEKIITLRKQNGWSQEELAEHLEISRQAVSKWELGASIPDIDKIVKMSELFGVTTDYLLKEETEETTISETMDSYEESNPHFADDAFTPYTGTPSCEHIVSKEEAINFMEQTQKRSGRIALAVSILVLSPTILILLGGLAESHTSFLTEDMAGGFGVVALLLLVAIAVGILITNGMSLSKYEYLEKEPISLQSGVQNMVQTRKEEFEPTYRASVVSGVVLCILGVIPLMIAAAFDAGDFIYICCTDLLLIFIACGVYLFVRFGSIQGSYDKLLQSGDYTKEKKEIGKKTSAFAGIYWCLVTALYLGISFTRMSWSTSWIIWPVAGVLFAALNGIVTALTKTGAN